jgi:hypothetical protein
MSLRADFLKGESGAMKTKTVLLSVAVFLILLVATGAIWWTLRPQVVTFSDDSKITLLKVEYGKHHAPPTVKATTSAAAPGRPARPARSNIFNTTNDTLVLWMHQQYDSGSYHYFQYYIYDKNGTACVQGGGGYGGNNRGNEVVPVRIEAFPRREGKFYVVVEENGNGGQEIADKKFVISNPEHNVSAKWTADSLPSTQTDDDLSVTLSKLVAKAKMPFNRGDTDEDDAMNKGVQATFHVERDGKAVSNWLPVSVETSDATGNHVNGWSQTFGNYGNGDQQTEWPDGDGTLTYQYGLWPGEPWKIKLEFSQQSNFADYELWSLADVPVVSGRQQEMYNGNRRVANTNVVYSETDLNGFHVKLFPAKQFTDVGNNDWMQGGLFLQISPAKLEGYRVTVKCTDNQTNDIPCFEYSNTRNNNTADYRFRLQDIAGLTNLNVSVAIHKSRFVEFTAKPEIAAATADNTTDNGQ